MNANRIVAYAIAVLGLLTALLPVVATVDWTTLAGVIAGLTATTAVALSWLTGWQQQEKAEQQAWLIRHKSAVEAEEILGAQQAAQQASAPRGAKPIIPPGLPR